MGNVAYADVPLAARLSSEAGRLAASTSARSGSGKGTSVPVARSAWGPRRAETFTVTFTVTCTVRRLRQVRPAMPIQFGNGVLADVCPGHRTWSPPV